MFDRENENYIPRNLFNDFKEKGQSSFFWLPLLPFFFFKIPN
jgi:hypothetical protein